MESTKCSFMCIFKCSEKHILGLSCKMKLYLESREIWNFRTVRYIEILKIIPGATIQKLQGLPTDFRPLVHLFGNEIKNHPASFMWSACRKLETGIYAELPPIPYIDRKFLPLSGFETAPHPQYEFKTICRKLHDHEAGRTFCIKINDLQNIN